MALLPTTNITPTIVGTELGSASRGVGALCNSSAVNKFSKYKPVETGASGGLSEEQFANLGYGLIVQDIGSSQGNGEWKYNRPVNGGRRIGDFRKYYHAAPVAMRQDKGASLVANRFNGGTVNITFTIPAAPTGYENYCLNISNIIPFGDGAVLLGNHWLCAAIYSGSTLKGTYWSKSAINYSSVDMNGASISFSTGTGFNSASEPIENYAAGNYTIYLYITQGRNLEVGVTRKYWAINYTTSYPRSLSCQVLGLNDVFSVAMVGIKPGGGASWANGDTGYKLGNLSYTVVGTISAFDVCYRITNISSQYAFLDEAQVFIYYNQLSTWGVAPARTYVASGSSTLSIPPGNYADLVRAGVLMMPTYIPTDSYIGSFAIDAHLHYGASDSGELFSGAQSAISLGYNY